VNGSAEPTGGAVRLGRAAFPVVLLAWLLACVAIGHAVLFTRPLWLDEYHTVLVAAVATPVQVVRDLTGGVDLAPPLLHFVAWTLRHGVGPLTPSVLHTASFICVAAALAFVYGTLRRTFDRASCIAGAMAVGSHALVVSHAFEARYYGPWLALCAFFCWAVGIDRGAARSLRREASVAAAAIGVCTIHWFGVLTLVLMCAGAGAALALKPRSDASRGLRSLVPALAGGLALLVCIPLLFAQRSRFTTPIWVPDLSTDQVLDMARSFYVALVPIAAALVLLASTFGERADSGRRLRDVMRDPGIASAAALALMPVVVTLVSLLVQPTMLPRYAIAATLAWAPLVAAACRLLRVPYRAIACGLLGVLWWMNLSAEAETKRAFARAVDADVRAFDAARGSGMPVLFQSRHVMYPVAAKREPDRGEMTLLVLPDSLLASMFPARSAVADMDRFFRFEREAVLLHREAFGFPGLVTPASLASTHRFLLIGSDASLPRGYKDVRRFGAAVFPAFRVTRVRADVALFARQ
jgi:hypothetical protein